MTTHEERMAELEGFQVEAEQPNIEATSEYINYELGSFSSPLNFADREAYLATRFAKEAENIALLQQLIDTGDYFVNLLYTYRSISKALPQIKQETPNRDVLYRKMFEVIEPEIKKIRDFMSFTEEVVSTLSKLVSDVISLEKKKEICSDTLLDYVIRLLDIMLKLDSLKNMKAALSNDYAAYKRAIQFMNRDGLDPSINLDIQSEENLKLYQFLGRTSALIKSLKDSFTKLSGAEDIIILLANRCVDNLELERFVFADEKHCVFRVLVTCIFMVDGNTQAGTTAQGISTQMGGSNSSSSSANTSKILKAMDANRLYKLFKRYPCIPLFGDMTFTVKTVLKNCPSLNEADWSVNPKDEEKLEQQFLIVNQINQIRSDCNGFTTRFMLLVNRLKAMARKGKEPTEEERKIAKEMCEQGIRHIANWTSLILEQCAWKYTHPASLDKIKEQLQQQQQFQDSEDASMTTNANNVTDYERVVKFNYTADERAALVDLICILKGLESCMLEYSNVLAPLIREQIHNELQIFIQGDLNDMLFRAKKKNRAVYSTLIELRNIGADWVSRQPPLEIKKRGKKDPPPQVPKKTVGPSYTQLHMIRSILTTLYSDRSPGMIKKGLLGAVDFSKSQLESMRNFYNASCSWTYLLNFNTSLRRASDLGDLWYREFYLEISKNIQFPIEQSLPWILTEDILEKKNTVLMESLVYPLSLYNDAASKALFTLQRRFLYDEVEAEVNLVFDQLVYKLSEQIYSYYKIMASNILLDNTFKSSVEKIDKLDKQQAKLNPQQQLSNMLSKIVIPKSRYDVLMQQHNVNLLGRSIDLNYLICQRINTTVRDNVSKVIQRFESGPLSGIVELEQLLQAIRLTHKLLSNQLTLDSFDTIMNEMNENTSSVSFDSRIARHIQEELIYEFFPKFIFNFTTQRFVQAPVLYEDDQNGEDKYERERAPRLPPYYLYGTRGLITSFNFISEQYKGFFGMEHMQSLIDLVSTSGVAVIVESCMLFIESKIYTDLKPYVSALMEAIPPQIKLQPPAYGLYGVCSYFEHTFRDFSDYDMLRPGVFQSFKIIGNCLAFIMLIELCLANKNMNAYIAAAPFTGLKPLSRKQKEIRKKLKDFDDEQGGTDPLPAHGNSGDFSNMDQATMDLFIRHEDPNQTPLVRQMNAFFNQPDIQRLLYVPELASALPKQAAKLVNAYNPPRYQLSILTQSLRRLHNVLSGIRNEWKGINPSDRLQKLDSSKEFYRLWGILQFVFCMEDPNDKTANPDKVYKDYEVFGDGFFISGSIIVYLFGQQSRFDAFNFCDHVLNISVINSKGKEQILPFLKNATQARSINNRIFRLVQTHYPLSENTAESYQAPDSEDFTKVKMINMSNSPAPMSQSISSPSVSYDSQQNVPQTPSYDYNPAPAFDAPPPPPPPPPMM